MIPDPIRPGPIRSGLAGLQRTSNQNPVAIAAAKRALATANLDKAMRHYMAPVPVPLTGDQVVHVLSVFFGLNGLEGPAILRLLADAHDAAEGRVSA